MNDGASQITWQNISAAARQLALSDPFAAFTLYRSAVAECKKLEGPNSEKLAILFSELAAVCVTLERHEECKSYIAKAEQIRTYNRQCTTRFSSEQGVVIW